MATDVAEVIGGAIALSLLFDLPLVVGGAVTGSVSMLVLMVQGRGRPKTFERVIVSMMVIIVVGFSAGLVIKRPRSPRRRPGWSPDSRAAPHCCSPRPFSAPPSCRTPATLTQRSPATDSAPRLKAAAG